MVVFFSIFIGSIILFVILYLLYIGLDHLRFQLTADEAVPSRKRRGKGTFFKKLLYGGVIMSVLALLALILMFSANSTDLLKMFKKEELKDTKAIEAEYRKNLRAEEALRSRVNPETLANEALKQASDGGKGSSQSQKVRDEIADKPKGKEEEEKHSQNEGSVTSPISTNAIGDEFLPSTYRFRMQKLKEDPVSEAAKNAPVTLGTVKGARKGDFFVCTFYDAFRNGRLIRGADTKLLPQNPEGKETIACEGRVPYLDRGKTTQLPILLNGYIIPKQAENDHLTIRKDGTVEALANTTAATVTYVIKRCALGSSVAFGHTENDTISSEYADIPDEILAFLRSVKSKGEQTRLTTIASIMNSYFGYQTGLKNVIYKRGKTWNSLLKEKLKSDQRMLADCDVLSTYGYIYLRYLGFKPVIIIGSLITADNVQVIKPEDLHATIYLKISGKWTIFEPTVFTNNYTVEIINEKAAPGKGSSLSFSDTSEGPSTVSATPKNGGSSGAVSDDMAQSSSVKFFKVPDALARAFKTKKSTTPQGSIVSQAIIDCLDNEEDDETLTEEAAMESVYEKIAQFSILLYALAFIFAKMFLMTLRMGRRIIPLSGIRRLFHIAAITAIYLQILLRAIGYPFPFWSMSETSSIAGPIAAFLTAILAIYFLLSFLFQAPQRDGKSDDTFIPQLYWAVQAILIITALIYTPNIIAFAGSAILILTFFFRPGSKRSHTINSKP